VDNSLVAACDQVMSEDPELKTARGTLLENLKTDVHANGERQGMVEAKQ
jgi:hypothetical protein